jgi:hypothetical protein
MLDSKQTALADFEQHVSDVRSEQSRERDARQWKFVLPFPVQLATDLSLPQVVAVRQSDFAIGLWSNHAICLRPIDLSRIKLNSDPPSDPMPVVAVHAKGATAGDAWQEIQANYDSFRGTIEFLNGFCRTSRSSPLPKALHQVAHPGWMVAIETESNETIPFVFQVQSDDHRARAKFVLTSSCLDDLRSFASEILSTNPLNEIQLVIHDCLRLLCQALDHPEPWHAFVGLWQLAEAATCSEANNKKVAQRLAAMMELRRAEPQLHAVLQDFAQLRNSAVHQGLHGDIGQDEVNFLKICCDYAIDWLVASIGDIPTVAHLHAYFDAQQKSNEELQAMIDGTTIAMSDRAKRTELLSKK